MNARFNFVWRLLGAAAVGLTLSPQPVSAQSPLPDSFNPGANARVLSLAVQSGGKILVGGGFTTLGGRLNNTTPATQSLTFDGSTITWLRGGTSPEVWRTTFDISTDGLTWTNLGAGTRLDRREAEEAKRPVR